MQHSNKIISILSKVPKNHHHRHPSSPLSSFQTFSLLVSNNPTITTIIQKSFFSSSTITTQQQQQHIKIVEVGPRDGLQNESIFIPTPTKINFINKLINAGCNNVEVTSFVSPKVIPALEDHSEVMSEIVTTWKKKKKEDDDDDDGREIILSSLVPNVKGLEKACEVGAMDEVAIFGSVSETFSKKNINCSVQESITRFHNVSKITQEKNIPLRGYISCVLGCPYEGNIKPSSVAKYAEQLLELGCHEISLGDTIGVGTPKATVEMLREVKTVADTKQIAVHFHDTYGQALANIYASITEEGISVVDSSVAGLGGCPYAKGASGNVATEDVIYMLHGMGMHTGIDLDQLIEAGLYISNVLGRPTRSKVALALSTKKG